MNKKFTVYIQSSRNLVKMVALWIKYFHQVYEDWTKIDDFLIIIDYLNRELNFPINETYFDRSKFNINYREKILENINNYKSTLLSAINEFELFGKSKLNQKLIENFDDNNLECDENINLSNFRLSDDFNEFLEHINKSKKLDIKDFDQTKLNNNFVTYDTNNDNYLISPAYQDFYYYFRYHILEKIINN